MAAAEAAVGEGDCAPTAGGIFSMDMPVRVLADVDEEEEEGRAAEGGERRCSAARKWDEVETDDSSGDEREPPPLPALDAEGRGD